jgi:hypothetical protein
MKSKKLLLVASILIPSIFACASALAKAEDINFRVFLNDDEIGFQQVLLDLNNNQDFVCIESDLKMKVLFSNAYSYQHTTKEVWQNQCLTKLNSDTKEKGEVYFVRTLASTVKTQGDQTGFSLPSQDGTSKLPGCIRSFAYWDIGRLYAKKLLNAQTGKYVPAQLSEKGNSKLNVGSQMVPVTHYILSEEGTDINIYYDQDDQWVALQTKVKRGRVLSYYRTPHLLPAK